MTHRRVRLPRRLSPTGPTAFEATWEEFDGERDPVPWLITYPPKVAISRRVNSLKGVSSRLIRKKHYPGIERALWGGSLWSPSYFGSAGEAPLSIIKQYIEQQETLIDPYGVSARYFRLERRSFTAHSVEGPLRGALPGNRRETPGPFSAMRGSRIEAMHPTPAPHGKRIAQFRADRPWPYSMDWPRVSGKNPTAANPIT